MNMAFFDDLGKKISSTSQSVMNKGKGMVDITKMKAQIAEEEKRINKYYENLGKMYYDLKKDEPLLELREVVEMVKNSYLQIENLNKAIEAIESSETCPNCGAVIEKDMLFCTGCGMKVDQMKQQNSTQKQQQPTSRFCTSCGHPLLPGAMFCTKCGAKQN